MTILALSGLIRPLLEPRLPEGLDVRWFMTKEEALTAVPEAEIGWFDMYEQDAMAETLRAATNLKWLNSIYAGLDFLPMDVLIERRGGRPGQVAGRSPYMQAVNLAAGEDLVGSIISCRVTEARQNSIVGAVA